MTFKYKDLQVRFGDLEALRTIEVLEAVVAHADNLDRISQPAEQRFVNAMERISKTNFAA